MPSPIVIPAKDPRPLEVLFQSNFRTPQDQARITAELIKALNIVGTPGADRTSYRDAMVDAGSEYTRRMSGRKPGLLDTWDDLQMAISATRAFGEIVDAAESTVPFAKSIIDVGQAIKGPASAAQIVLATPWVQDYINDDRARVGARYSAELTDAYSPAFGPVLGAVMKAADQDPQLVKALQDRYPQIFTNPSRDAITAGGCFEDNPNVFNNVSVIVKADNSVVIKDIDLARTQIIDTITAMGTDFSGRLGDVNARLTEIDGRNKEIAAEVNGLAVFLRNNEKTETAQRNNENARHNVEKVMSGFWEAAQGTVSGAAAIASLLGDRKLAKDITRYGNAAITVGKAVVGFANALSALTAGLSAVTALGAAAATGNLLGAVAALTSLFAPDGPSPEEQILSGIGDIKSQLHTISAQIADGFDRLDGRLNKIYSSVMDSLGEIAATTIMTLAEVQRINRAMADQSRLIGQLTVETGEWFRAAERANLKEDINTALGWAGANTEPLPASDFSIFCGHLYNWAVSLASDEINQPVTGRDLGLGAAATELQGSLNDNLSYLNRLLLVLGKPALTKADDATSLPNPQMWALASVAFAQLRSEWPYLARPDDPRVAEMIYVGTAIRTKIQDCALNPDLFPSLSKDYTTAADQLGSALKSYRTRFERAVLPMSLGYSPGDPSLAALSFDLSSGVDQDCHFEPQVASLTGGSGGTTLAAPADLYKVIPPAFLLADFIEAGPSRLTFTWAGRAYTTEQWRENPRTGVPFKVVFHWVDVDVHGRYDGEIVGGYRVQRAGAPGTTPITDYVAQNWQANVKYLDALNSPSERFPLELTIPEKTTATAQERALIGLTNARQQFVGHAVWELTEPNGLMKAEADTLQGAWYLLENMTRLLFPAPRANDDLLRSLFEGQSAVAGGIRMPDVFDLSSGLSTTFTDNTINPPLGRGIIDLQAWVIACVGGAPTLLQERVALWQSHIKDGKSINPLPPIDDALDRLKISEDVVRRLVPLHTMFTTPHPAIRAIQRALRLPEAGVLDATTGKTLSIVRKAAFEKQPTSLEVLRAAIGSAGVGAWSTTDQKALTACVRRLQPPLDMVPDGFWGPVTENAYQELAALAQLAGVPIR